MKFSFALIALVVLLSFVHSEKKKIIYLVRHGETDFNTDPVPRVRGRINVPLNAKGIAHCKAAGDFLANENIGKIYYSSIPRAKQSAECIVQQHSSKVCFISLKQKSGIFLSILFLFTSVIVNDIIFSKMFLTIGSDIL